MTKEILIVLSVVIATILFAVPLAGTAAAGYPRAYVGPDGTLAPLAGSTRFLSAASTALKDH